MHKTTANEQPEGQMTPMMAQYMAVKKQYPGCLLFYRMGDFYEMFFDDAIRAAETLDITLTKRGSKGEDVPMCGVPVHSHESYVARLIKNGYKVAICEQVETPEEAKKRGGYKALVQRDVIRVITQGTLTEDTLLEKNANNYLACVAAVGPALGMAWLDLSTGDFMLQPVVPHSLSAAIERVGPSEILISDKLASSTPALDDYKERLTLQPASRFDSENARKRLETLFGVGTLESFGGFNRAEIAAAGALIDYVELTQKGKFPRLSPPRQLAAGSVMEIDGATRRNLELTQTLSGERRGSLLSSIDMTITGAGSRLLAQHLSMPLTDANAVNDRLDMVEFFVKNPEVREKSRTFLRQCADIERALARLSLGRGGPRDLAAIRDTLAQTIELCRILTGLHAERGQGLPPGIGGIIDVMKGWGNHHPLVAGLQEALATELPVLARDGNFIAARYRADLDELRSLRDEGRGQIARLQEKYIKATGISTLKIRHNNIIGYHIEVTALHADKLLNKGDYIHRQTMSNNVRFATVELSEFERKIAEAGDRALALELALFAELSKAVLDEGYNIATTALALARLDVSAALAELAVNRHYTRPVVDRSTTFDIKDGRHPVVEAMLDRTGGKFIANDCALAEASKIWLLTGPNMAGKSTFLRQNALIALMAQMGSFVPAKTAHIGAVDRLFSRVGAADDLARGRSTFMVEMVETAAILNQAGERSLVILDEIGRGTATFDGLSIAWATIEHLHDVNKCRALFATHYHELTSLTDRLKNLACHTMRVREWQDSVIFLHEVTSGAADRSYGIHVGKLAGLPPAVIARAEEVLATLESGQPSGTLARMSDELPLFSAKTAPSPAAATKAESEVETLLKATPLDDLSPRQAQDFLYRLRGLVQE